MSRNNQHLEDDDKTDLQGGEVTTRRRERRKPKLKRTRKDLLLTPAPAAQGTSGTAGLSATAATSGAAAVASAGTDAKFADADLQALYDRGYFDTFIGELKGGKEATVYLVGREDERYAAKVYADIQARSFRDDRVYWQGFFIGDARTERAMKKRSKAGLRAQQAIWVGREYHYLWLLHQAGIRVPRPAIGPEPFYYQQAGSVVLMEFVGEGDVPAPRLSDIRLEPHEATSAFDQTIALLERLCGLGLVHGDLSTYNLLWHRGEVWLIDVPQMVVAGDSRAARSLLERDVRSLVTSFRRLGIDADPFELLRKLKL